MTSQDPDDRHKPSDDLRRMPGWAWAAVALVMIVGIVWATTGPSRQAARERAQAEEQARADEIAAALAPREVTYEVDGTARFASITMQSPTGTSQADIRLPLANQGGTRGVTNDYDRGDFLYISAQNSADSGTVTCRITVDGEVISENTSSAAYGIATCEGTA